MTSERSQLCLLSSLILNTKNISYGREYHSWWYPSLFCAKLSTSETCTYNQRMWETEICNLFTILEISGKVNLFVNLKGTSTILTSMA